MLSAVAGGPRKFLGRGPGQRIVAPFAAYAIRPHVNSSVDRYPAAASRTGWLVV